MTVMSTRLDYCNSLLSNWQRMQNTMVGMAMNGLTSCMNDTNLRFVYTEFVALRCRAARPQRNASGVNEP